MEVKQEGCREKREKERKKTIIQNKTKEKQEHGIKRKQESEIRTPAYSLLAHKYTAEETKMYRYSHAITSNEEEERESLRGKPPCKTDFACHIFLHIK